MLPVSFSDIADALVAIQRIGNMLQSDEGADKLDVDDNAKFAVAVKGDFSFEEPFIAPAEEKKVAWYKRLKRSAPKPPSDASLIPDAAVPFKLKDLDLEISKGA